MTFMKRYIKCSRLTSATTLLSIFLPSCAHADVTLHALGMEDNRVRLSEARLPHGGMGGQKKDDETGLPSKQWDQA
jgi:hypothetical protein